MDLQSLLGYSQGSPYASNPYLDIHTPEGLIDMSNTPMDLIGIDNKGNKKRMKAGRKNPYKFEGTMVREIPMQVGGPFDPSKYTQGQDNLRRMPLVDLKAITDSNTLPAKFNKSLVRAKQQSRTQEVANTELARRRALIDKSNTQGGFRNSAVAEKMRLFPNDVGGWGEVFDDNLNPLKIVGSMADDLGHAKTVGDFAGAVGTPLAFGLTEGLMRRPVRPSSSQEVLSSSSGMDAVYAKQPGYNSHLFNKQGYVPPTTDPALITTLNTGKNPYVSPIEGFTQGNHFRKNMKFNLQQIDNVEDGWKAAKKLTDDGNEFVLNATSPNFLYESKIPLYKNWDNIKQEIDVREAFNIGIPKSPSKNDAASKIMSFFPDPPMTSSEASKLLDNYNPTKYGSHDYKTLKVLEDKMHNKRMAATYLYPNAMEDASLIGPVKYDTRGNQRSLAMKAMNPPREQVIKNNDWFVKEDWKKLTQEMRWGDTEVEVEAARKAFLNNRNKKALEVTPYGMDFFKGISPQKLGGNIYQEGGFTKRDALNFLFEGDNEQPKTPVAPVEEEPTNTEPTIVETPDSDYELAMDIAMGNPYASSGQGNPYSNDLASKGEAYKNLDANVTAATKELLSKFPSLRLTSGRRSWGDKDAHPLGRAVDLSYDETAYDYYKNVIVPKYGFNEALNPNHGTGKHIHLGYY